MASSFSAVKEREGNHMLKLIFILILATFKLVCDCSERKNLITFVEKASKGNICFKTIYD